MRCLSKFGYRRSTMLTWLLLRQVRVCRLCEAPTRQGRQPRWSVARTVGQCPCRVVGEKRSCDLRVERTFDGELVSTVGDSALRHLPLISIAVQGSADSAW